MLSVSKCVALILYHFRCNCKCLNCEIGLFSFRGILLWSEKCLSRVKAGFKTKCNWFLIISLMNSYHLTMEHCKTNSGEDFRHLWYSSSPNVANICLWRQYFIRQMKQTLANGDMMNPNGNTGHWNKFIYFLSQTCPVIIINPMKIFMIAKMWYLLAICTGDDIYFLF